MNIIDRTLQPPSDFSWEGNTGEAIMLHTTLGNNYEGAESTLRSRHLSYHYIIDEDGLIYKLVDISRSAWHAGVTEQMSFRAKSFFGSTNPNRRTIGIAFVRNRHISLTDAQRWSAVELIKDIGARTGVRYTADNIFAHHEVTVYKPLEVFEKYRTQVVQDLVGFKDETDKQEKSLMLLIIQYLQQLVKQLKEEKDVKDN